MTDIYRGTKMQIVSIYAIAVSLLTFTSTGLAAPELSTPHIIPMKLGTPTQSSVQSAGVTWRGNTYHLVSLGSATFNLDTNDCLKADIQAGVTGFDNVDYDISGAVFDAAGQLLGTARTPCKVVAMWAGNVEMSAQTITLDFGTSLDYKRAAGFTVSISNRKVLTPDQWQQTTPQASEPRKE